MAFFAGDTGESLQVGADGLRAFLRGEETPEAELGGLILAKAIRGLGRL